MTTVEQISSFRLPAESSTWVALPQRTRRRRGGGRGGGGRGGGWGGRQGGGGAQLPPVGSARRTHRQAAAGGAAGPAGWTAAGGGARQRRPPRERKDPGNDLIIRNLATGQDVTIPEVTEFAWDKTGSWLVYAVSSPTHEGRRVRAPHERRHVRALHAGRGHYKSLAFDEDGKQLAFLSDQADYDKPVSPYRLYYWKTWKTRPRRAGLRRDARHAAGQRGRGFCAALHGGRRAAAPRPPVRRRRRRPIRTCGVRTPVPRGSSGARRTR